MELWFKSMYRGDFKSHKVVYSDDYPLHPEILTVPPGTQSKNGYHLVLTQTDLPKLSALAVPVAYRGFPSTLREIHTGGWNQGTFHLEKAVCQLLASGYAGNEQCRILLRRLEQLDRAFGILHRALQSIPDEQLRLADEQVTGKK